MFEGFTVSDAKRSIIVMEVLNFKLQSLTDIGDIAHSEKKKNLEKLYWNCLPVQKPNGYEFSLNSLFPT